MKETTPKLLQIPEIALSIIINLDPSTLLSIRLVSLPINTLIQSADCLQKNFHLKTLIRLPKAVELARRANKNLECYADAGPTKLKAKRYAEATGLRPTSLYPAFLGRCARAILIIGTVNDIREHLDQSKPLPSYISSPPPPNRRERLRRLFSRMKNVTSKNNSASLSPAEANAQAISTHIDTIVPRSKFEVQSRLSVFDAARETYLKSLSRDHRIDLVWVQEYLFIGLGRGTRGRPSHHGTREELGCAMKQSPGLMLSMCSDDQRVRDWAWNLAGKVVHARQSDVWIDDRERIIPFPPGEEGWGEEARRAKRELTKGDWRD